MKAELQIKHSSSETQESLAWERKRSGWLRENPWAPDPGWQVEGEGRKEFFLPTYGQLSRTKAALSPDEVLPTRPPPEAKGRGCQVTGRGVFSVSAASCPGKPDSQVGHLSGMDGRRAHCWGHPQSSGLEQLLCQLLRSQQLPPPLVGGCFCVKWISSNIYITLGTLALNNLICSFLHHPA